MSWRITVKVRGDGGDGTTPVFEQSRLVVGRGRDCDIVVADPGIARRHCALEVGADGSAKLVDLGSTNGTFLDDVRVTAGSAPLRVGDTVRLGATWTLRLAREPEALETPEPVVSESLRPHRSSSTGVIRSISARIARIGEGLEVVYWLAGDLDQLDVPVGPLDPLRLWEQTCAELFIREARSERYVEWNFSPTGQATRFDFERYRQRSRVVLDAPVRVVAQRHMFGLRIAARGPMLEGLEAPGLLSFAAVVRGLDGGESYWAAEHPQSEPDFHHADGFTVDARDLSR